MNILSQLAQSVDIFSIDSSTKLQKQALSKGFTQDQLDGISKNELNNFGNWSYFAFKTKVLGMTGIIVSLLMLGLVLFSSPAANVDGKAFIIIAIIFALLSVVIFRFGKNEELRSALAIAVLREKASGMSHDQISILKDHPEIRTDRDTQKMLQSLQENINVSTATR